MAENMFYSQRICIIQLVDNHLLELHYFFFSNTNHLLINNTLYKELLEKFQYFSLYIIIISVFIICYRQQDGPKNIQ